MVNPDEQVRPSDSEQKHGHFLNGVEQHKFKDSDVAIAIACLLAVYEWCFSRKSTLG